MVREASHAGSWYKDDPDELNKELDEYLLKAEKKVLDETYLKAVIGPHAGIMYSGACAAWAYININPERYKRVFILGGAHIYNLPGAWLSQCSKFATPFGDIRVDIKTTYELGELDGFKFFPKKIDEHEHWIELHLPYIKKIFKDHDIGLVPIMFGELTYENEQYYGNILAPYLKDEDTLFIVSTDFWHWGKNYDFYPHDKTISEDINEYVAYLDKQGMDKIEEQDAKGFVDYWNKTQNNIWGRHPIAVYLEALKNSGLDTTTKFVNVDHTCKINSKKDSSVTYASSYTVVNS